MPAPLQGRAIAEIEVVAGLPSPAPTFRPYALKRTLDVLGAGLLLVVAAPLMAVVAAAIRLDSPGPALFHQVRVGLNRRRSTPGSVASTMPDRRRQRGEGRPFLIHKFRTMEVPGHAAALGDAGLPPLRVTRVGKWLRGTHLDELPQLWNVLRGEMSLVGPRPEQPHYVVQFADSVRDYRNRLQLLPGVTGLAQLGAVYDFTVEDVERKLARDIAYARQMRLATDLRILWRTALDVVARMLGRPPADRAAGA